MVALADWFQEHFSTNPISTWEHFPVSMEYDEDSVSPYCCSMRVILKSYGRMTSTMLRRSWLAALHCWPWLNWPIWCCVIEFCSKHFPGIFHGGFSVFGWLISGFWTTAIGPKFTLFGSSTFVPNFYFDNFGWITLDLCLTTTTHRCPGPLGCHNLMNTTSPLAWPVLLLQLPSSPNCLIYLRSQEKGGEGFESWVHTQHHTNFCHLYT